MGKEGGPFQFDLPGFGGHHDAEKKHEDQEGEVSIRAGTTIFLDTGGRGDLRYELRAKKLSHKVKGLSGYVSLERIDLQYRALGPTRYWSMPAGTQFGTWSKFAHSPKK